MYYKSDRIGETNVNKYGNKMKIIKYNHSKDIDVLFEDYNCVAKNKHYIYFKNGTLTSPYDRTIYEKGYLGEGKYKKSIDNIPTILYYKWNEMFDRCYNEKYLKRQPTYIGCSVCEEWFNFQNFAQWYEDNYYEVSNEKMCLDKDILFKNNKIYSPSTCVIVPNSINILFTRNELHRTDNPIGVCEYKDKFIARCKVNGKSTHIGIFNTREEAFYDGYKPFKENNIKRMADEYKNFIPNKLYVAMYNWEVSIND